jgi:hypothetical protein
VTRLLEALQKIETTAKTEGRDSSSHWYYELNPDIDVADSAYECSETYRTLFRLAPEHNTASVHPWVAFDPRPRMTLCIRGDVATLDEMRMASQVECRTEGMAFSDTAGFQALREMDGKLRNHEAELFTALRAVSAPTIKDYLEFLEHSRSTLTALAKTNAEFARSQTCFAEWLAALDKAITGMNKILKGHGPEEFLLVALTKFLAQSVSLGDLHARSRHLNEMLDGVDLSFSDALFFDKILQDRGKTPFTVMMNGSQHTNLLKRALVVGGGYQVTAEFHPVLDMDEDGVESELFNPVHLIRDILARVQESML